MKKKILLGLLLVSLLIQVIRPDMTNPEVNPEMDYITVTQPTEEVAAILKTSCYDCHSNQTEYMWYMQIAPVSWWTMDHVDEGRKELNFSNWGEYKLKRQKHKLKECIELIEEKEMPLDSYTWMHSEASLTDEQRQVLIDWFKAGMN